MKKMFSSLIGAGALLCLLSSCSNDLKPSDDGVDTAKKMNEELAENKTATLSERDADFVVMAADAGMAEIALGKIVLSGSGNDAVKKFARMMIDDHTAINDQLLSIAAARLVTLPSSVSDRHKKDIEEMGRITGEAFDKAYLDRMTESHDRMVEAFRKTEETTKDAALKDFAAKTLPLLLKHQDRARSLQEQIKAK